MVRSLNCDAAIFFMTFFFFFGRTKRVMPIFKVISSADSSTLHYYTIYSIKGAARVAFSFSREHYWEMKMYHGALQNNWEAKKSNSCEFHLVVSGRMSIWQLVNVRRYLHCLKVDGDGEENQCGCKQCNGRVMCSPGQATPKKSCQGNAEQRRNSVFTSPSHCHIQSTCTSQLLKSVFKAVSQRCLFRMLTLQGRQSKHGMVR